MNNKLITVVCQDCGNNFDEMKTWHGQSEICKECAKKRTDLNNCKRHGGKHGQNCYPCKLEQAFG